MANITVNGTPRQIDVEPETPLLWVLREELGLTGPKFGCVWSIVYGCAAATVGKSTHAQSAVTTRHATPKGEIVDRVMRPPRFGCNAESPASKRFCRADPPEGLRESSLERSFFFRSHAVAPPWSR